MPWDRWTSILIPPSIIRHCFLAAAPMQTVMCFNAFSCINYNGIQDLIQLSKFSSQTFLVNKICLEIKFLRLKIYVLDFFYWKVSSVAFYEDVRGIKCVHASLVGWVGRADVINLFDTCQHIAPLCLLICLPTHISTHFESDPSEINPIINQWPIICKESLTMSAFPQQAMSQYQFLIKIPSNVFQH